MNRSGMEESPSAVNELSQPPVLPSIYVIDSYGNKLISENIINPHLGSDYVDISATEDKSDRNLLNLNDNISSINSHCFCSNSYDIIQRSLSQGDVNSLRKKDHSEDSSCISGNRSDSTLELSNQKESKSTSFNEYTSKDNLISQNVQHNFINSSKTKKDSSKNHLDVVDKDFDGRKRSHSYGEIPHAFSAAHYRVKGFFEKLRSNSNGEISIVQPSSKKQFHSNSSENIVNATTNKSSFGLLPKLKGHMEKQSRRKPLSKSNQRIYEKETDVDHKTHLQFHKEPEKKRSSSFKRNVLSRFKKRHLPTERGRSGSLPNVIGDCNQLHLLESMRISSNDSLGLNMEVPMSLNPNGMKKDNFYGDFAIEDYFSENDDFSTSEKLKVAEEKEKTHKISNIYRILLGRHSSLARSKSHLDEMRRNSFDSKSSRSYSGTHQFSNSGSLGAGDGHEEDMVSSEPKDSPKGLLSGPVISYTVQSSDTLMSIAARFDTTPSELTKSNRLSTRFLFPDQILIVPDKGGTKENVVEQSQEEQAARKDSVKSLVSGDLATPKTLTPVQSVDDVDRSLDRECLEKFLKIEVRHITDGQGVVAGVLLVTPNAVMFNPNVSDPLVIERGYESYGVIAPMEFVVNAALYYDIAHMKVKDSDLTRPDIPKPEIYRLFSAAKNAPSDEGIEEKFETPEAAVCGDVPDTEESPSKDTTILELASNDNDNDSSCSCGGDTRETSAFPKAFEEELLTPMEPQKTAGGSLERLSSETSERELECVVDGRRPGAKSASPLPKLNLLLESSGAICPNDESEIKKQPLTVSSSLPPTHLLSQVTNEKKRATSVVSSTSSESDMPPVPEDKGFEVPSHETRKQKVLKRISYPLSWMESFGAESKECLGGIMPHPPGPHSASFTGGLGGPQVPQGPEDIGEGTRHGMFSNVFNMSNVSNMLTRRTSSDTTRRPSGQAGNIPIRNPSSESLSSPTKAPQAEKRSQYKEGSKCGLKSMVSIEDMPDLFASFDKLIPKPASSCDDSPLYLCLRMGSPLHRIIPRMTPITTYGRKMMRPEYWFSIPKARADDLYHFFQVWSKDIYGEVDEEAIRMRGYEILEEELEIVSDQSGEGGNGKSGIDPTGELKEITKESWEVVTMSEELRKALYPSNSLTSLDIEVFLPEILGSSEVVDDTIRKNMYRKLPARVQGYNWKLVFSSATHGFSLKSLYRKMGEIDSPILLFIEDTNKNIFGAFLSCPLRVSDLFYGTGESFLFVCQPEFQVFPWTGENTFFVKGNNESLYVGGGEGNFGIWLDGDLYHGRSQSCKTFGNLALSDSEDFIVKTIECWYFA